MSSKPDFLGLIEILRAILGNSISLGNNISLGSPYINKELYNKESAPTVIQAGKLQYLHDMSESLETQESQWFCSNLSPKAREPGESMV